MNLNRNLLPSITALALLGILEFVLSAWYGVRWMRSGHWLGGGITIAADGVAIWYVLWLLYFFLTDRTAEPK